MPKDKYNCKENDCHIICVTEENCDQGCTEFWIGDCVEQEWTVIGINDLKEALDQFGIEITDGSYKSFYNENRVRILQYNSLRKNFQKMVNDVLGIDYYNMGMDVYECDKQCCKDITRKSKGFFKNLLETYKMK